MEKPDVLNGHLIEGSFKPEAYRLARTKQVFPERLIVSSVPAAGRPPASPTPINPQDIPDGPSKIISLSVSKK